MSSGSHMPHNVSGVWVKDFVHTVSDFDESGHDEEVEHELLALVYDTTPIVLAANLVNGTLIAAVFYGHEAISLVAGWWLLMCLMVVVRGALWMWYRTVSAPIRGTCRFAIISSAISGVLWGTAGYMFYSPESVIQTMVLGFVLGGMGAGAVSALTPCLPAFYAYLIPSILPYSIRLASEGDLQHWVMAAAVGLYTVSLCVLGRKANWWLKESVSQRIANAEIIRSLEHRVAERTSELERLNHQLHLDIAERTRAEAILADYAGRQTAIADFGRTALSGIEMNVLFETAVKLVRDRLSVAGAAIIEGAAENGTQTLRASAGSVPSTFVPEPGSGLADHPPPALLADPRPDILADGARSDGSIDVAHAAISIGHFPFGVLVALAEAPRDFSAIDMSFLRSIANMLTSAIERKQAEQDIEHLALHDTLTGLPNRELFRNHLQQELARLKRSRGLLALLLLDLDHFKDVNDTLGHPIGDRLLETVARRLKDCVREVDAPARLGGDEFAVILSDLRSPEEAASVARKIVERVSEPFVLEGHMTRVGASIGITMSPDDDDDVDGLLRNADLALYRAKSEQRNTYRFYSADMTVQIEDRKALEHDLIDAFERDELFMEYQPQFDLASGRLAGAEALVRWRHPSRGLLVPDLFIPVAEMTGLIVPLGFWVLDRVAKDVRKMRDAGSAPGFVASNISLSQCRNGDLVDAVKQIAVRDNTVYDWLELEVTEHLFLPPSDCIDALRRLRKLGVTISIDDFGTGYSSFGRLINLPVDKIKIDRTFLRGLGKTSNAEMLVRAIIRLAGSLGLAVTAEGVETRQQLEFLAAEGCTFGQGHYFGTSLSVGAFIALARSDFHAPTADVRVPMP